MTSTYIVQHLAEVFYMRNTDSLNATYNPTIFRDKVIEIIKGIKSKLDHDLDYYLPRTDFSELLLPAIAYIRFSDPKQRDKHSIEIQKYEITNRAKKEGYQIVLWCIDESVSATHNRAIERPFMQVLYKVAQFDEFQGAIFFFDDSRVSRQTTDFVREVYTPLITLKPYLKFICSDTRGVWDPNTPYTQIKLLLHRQQSVNQKSRALSYQQKCLYPENKKDFKRPAGHLPFGYVKGTEANPQIEISNGQAYVIFLIFYLASWGYSNDVIAKLLNKCNIKTPKNRDWSQGSIDKVLHNYYYLGHTTWDRRESRKSSTRKPDGQFSFFDDTHTGIIPPYLGTLVNQVRNFKKEFGLQMDTEFTLKGLIKCDKCNCVMVEKNTTSGGKKSKRVYRCPKCKNYIKTNEIHDIVFKKLSSLLIKNKSIMLDSLEKTLNKWILQLKKTSEKIQGYKDLVIYQSKMFDYELIGHEKELKSETNRMLSFLDSQIKNLNELINQLHSLLKDSELSFLFDRFFDNNFESLSLGEKRCILIHFMSEVKYDFQAKITTINYSKTPFIDLENWKNMYEPEQ